MPCGPAFPPDGLRRSQDPGDGDNRRIRTGETRALCRGLRLFFFLRQYGYGHRHPDDRDDKGIAYVQAGCGIVYDSVPEREYEETLNKARALLKAIEQAESRNG